MELKTKEFKTVIDTILLAVSADSSITNLEIVAEDINLKLNVTNKEFYCSCNFVLESPESFRAVVEAKKFLDLVAGISTETFSLNIVGNTVVVKTGRSSYKLPMIYENDQLVELQPILINNKTVEMNISTDILNSIAGANAKELSKEKATASTNEYGNKFYIDETGCFTRTHGACLNSFTLEKPIKLLLTDRIVKLFKLFKETVKFSLGYDAISADLIQTKVCFETAEVKLSVITSCNDALLNQFIGWCSATKTLIDLNYDYSVVLTVRALSDALKRLLTFTKNSTTGTVSSLIPGKISITESELTITDNAGNEEVLEYNNSILNGTSYVFSINLNDLKTVVDGCKVDHITLNCGNSRSIVVTHGTVRNVIPELRTR